MLRCEVVCDDLALGRDRQESPSKSQNFIFVMLVQFLIFFQVVRDGMTLKLTLRPDVAQHTIRALVLNCFNRFALIFLT